jgi:CRP-like cAMP-binding protein
MATDNDGLLPVLKKVTIFAGLSEDALKRILAESSFAEFAAGEVIIREGTQATDIFVVLEGRVKVVLGLGHEPLEMYEFGAGSCLGEVSVIGILDHSASVVAFEDTRVMGVSRKLLMRIGETDKETFALLILNIARELARRLHRTDHILLHYTGHDGEGGSEP